MEMMFSKLQKKCSGIGVRIEDDVLIAEDGPVVLTNMALRQSMK